MLSFFQHTEVIIYFNSIITMAFSTSDAIKLCRIRLIDQLCFMIDALYTCLGMD